MRALVITLVAVITAPGGSPATAAEYGLAHIEEVVAKASPGMAQLRSHYHRTTREVGRFFRDGTVPERPGAVPPAPAGTPIRME